MLDDDRQPNDPTPEQIRRQCAEIRSTWAQKRWLLNDWGRVEWSPPVHSNAELGLSEDLFESP